MNLKSLKSHRLLFKINISIFATFILLALVFTAIMFWLDQHRWERMLEQINLTLHSITEQKKEDLANEIFGDMKEALELSLADMLKIKGITIISIYNPQGKIYFSTDDDPAQTIPQIQSPLFCEEKLHEEPVATYTALIEIIGEKVGYIKIYYRLAAAEAESRLFIGICIAQLIFMLLCMFIILSTLLSRFVLGPVYRLRTAMHNILDGQVGEIVTHQNRPDGDEIWEMTRAFNNMSVNLKESQNKLVAAVQEKEIYAEKLEELNRELENTVVLRTAEFLKAKDEAETASKAKSEFLAVMSHEIRTPLNGMIGFTNLLSNTKLTGKQHDYLKKALSSAHTLLDVINNILDFSKIEAGQMELETSVFQLNDVMETVSNIFSIKIAEKNIKLLVLINPDVPGSLIGDPLRLKQILINLTNNAVKFTKQGEVSIKIELVEENHRQTTIKFSITDSGIGIPLEKHSQLFEAFTQVDLTTTRKYGGSGLGLAISKRLVETMGGKIWMQSEQGQGSTFFFTVNFKLQTQDQTATVSTKQPEPYEKKHCLQGLRVLLVEDNAINLEIAMEILKSSGVLVETAEHGRQAVTMLRGSFYDAVLMDIQMPIMDGYEATIMIRKLEKEKNAPATPIIAMTAHASKGDRELCFQAGMNAYITKPIDNDALFSTLLAQTSKTTNNFPKQPRVFDVDAGLKRLGGNRKLYQQLIKDFVAEYKHADVKIRMAMESGNLKAAQALIHTIKGVAGNLSAVKLYDKSLELEDVVKKNDQEKFDFLLDNFKQTLSEVCAG